jgi:serpin B
MRIAAFIALLSFFAACGGDELTNPTGPGQELRSDKARITEPSAVDVPELVAGNTRFALNMYHQLATRDGNIFFSPFSISVALAMTYAGARGNTQAQMADALEFTLAQEKLHPAFDWLDLALNSRGRGASGKDGEPFRLHVVNRLFGQVDYRFLDSFLDTLALYYGAALFLLDFIGDTEGSRQAINQWVEEVTEQRIKNLIPPGGVDTATRLVLVNAIYFNAAWKEVFDDRATAPGRFTLPDGSAVEVPMMQQPGPMPYAEGEGWRAVELPYDGEELSMVVIVPDDLAAFEKVLDAEKLASVIAALGEDQATLSMPRFRIKGQTIPLKDQLSALGMPDAFVFGLADFSGMDGTRQLLIGNVLHQAFVEVDEYGTEAAAATAVVMDLGSAQLKHLEVDRPFVFLIRDIQTGAILFLGRVIDPT